MRRARQRFGLDRLARAREDRRADAAPQHLGIDVVVGRRRLGGPGQLERFLVAALARAPRARGSLAIDERK